VADDDPTDNLGQALRDAVIAIIWLGQKVGREQDGLKG
jgi:hypothetical protein